MSIRLTILGKSPSWPDRGGACSGYLVEAGGSRLLLDCGNGVFAKLRLYADYEAVDEVLISHLHADHVLDLVPYSYALSYGPQSRSAPPRLHLPPGGRAALRRLCGSWGSETLIEDAFDLAEYDPAAELELATMRARFQHVPHYVPAYAVELRARGEHERLLFGADCGPNDELVEFAHGADLLLIESTNLVPEEGDEPPGHLTAAQAGAIGQQAGVGTLVLTHFSDQLDRSAVRAQAEAAFGRGLELAGEGDRYEI